MIRILLVDDESLVRAGLRTILESAEDLRVVAEAEDGSLVVDALAAHRPDVVLMDVRMPRVDGLEALRRVQATPDPPPVVMLTTFDLDAYIFEALRLGATGFLLKDTPPRDLISAMRVVARGLSNAQIGKNLYLSEATVKAHVSRVMAKLGVANRVQAALVGRDAGLLDEA